MNHPKSHGTMGGLVAALLWLGAAAGAAEYTACNIWYRDAQRISTVNYKLGSLLPAGSPVESLVLERDRIVFRIAGHPVPSFTLIAEYQENLTIRDLRARFFTDKPFDELTAGCSPRDIELIRQGRIEEGMSKAAVLISYGHPPPHRTPDLAHDTWYYWSEGAFVVRFDAQDRLLADPLAAGRASPARAQPAAPAPAGGTRYTACNIWYQDPKRLDTVNYRVGTLLPAGTPVRSLRLERLAIVFEVEGFATPFTMLISHQGDTPAQTFVDRFFTSKPLDELTAGLTPRERELIREATLEEGMSKPAVAIALGLPPPHRTPRLESNEWVYWTGRRSYALRFDAQGRLQPGPQVASPAPTPAAPPALAQAARDVPPKPPPAPPGPTPPAPPRVVAADGKCWAVVIGISEYQHAGQGALSNLAFADDDARAFATALRNQGWPASRIKTLINEQATLRDIMVTLESWLTKAGPNDLIVLFWSGHGFPDPEDPEKVYFACHDTDITIPATGYRMDRVHAALAERQARNVIVFADTCHAGKLMTRGEKGLSIVTHLDKLRAEKAVPKGWIFMVGADADRQAIEHSSWSNGAFTHCLLEGLAGAADGFESAGPKDGVVSMSELRAYLATMMPEETHKVLGAAKHPIVTTSSGDPGIWQLTLRRTEDPPAEPATAP